MQTALVLRRLVALLLVLVCYVLIGALLAEGVVRLARLAPPAQAPGYFWQTGHPITGWTLEPNAAGRWFNPMYEYDQEIRINSQGLRSPEVCVADGSGVACDDEDVLRIVVLGDSYVEALHVPLEASFGQVLARQLTQARLAESRRVEVINAGVSGWGTDQQLLWLREQGPRYAPDLVVLAFYPGNDFMNNHMALEYANFGSVRKPWFALETPENETQTGVQNDALTLHDFPYDGEAARASADQFAARMHEVLPAEVENGAENGAENAETADASGPESAAPPWLRPVGEWLDGHSALYRFVDPRLRVAAPDLAARVARWGLLTPGQETSDQELGPNYIPVTYGAYRAEPDPIWQEAFATTGALFEELQATADTLGADVGAILVTAPEQVEPVRWEEQVLARYPAMLRYDWELDAPTQRALDLFDQAGIPALNLLPLFREAAADGAALHFRDDGHWTEQGHAFAGALAANFLLVQGLASPAPGATVAVQIPGGAAHWVLWVLWFVVAVIVLSVAWSAYKNGPLAWLRGAWAGLETTGELFLFTLRRGQFVVLPLLVILILFGGLLLIAQSSVVGPFIYPLF